MTLIHHDDALDSAVEYSKTILANDAVVRIVVLDDMFGRIHFFVWLSSEVARGEFLATGAESHLATRCGPFWSSDLIAVVEGMSSPESEVLQHAMEVGSPIAPFGERLLLADRHRSRTSWFVRVNAPQEDHRTPPVVAFYSFKGGMGRTTAAAAYVLSRARAGDKVAVVDLDLDAPGIGRLLGTDEEGQSAQWGVLDFLLEHHLEYPLEEYRHVCARPELVEETPVDVFPAGAPNGKYLSKLAKIDFDVRGTDSPYRHPIAKLLQRIRTEMRPDVVVVDCRAGLAPVSGLMLTGLADVHVLFSTASTQAIDGLERVVHRLGAERLHRNIPQADCVLVHAMVPENVESRDRSYSYFDAKSEDVFVESYYARESDDADSCWSLDDKSSLSAPHRAVALPYAASLSDFRDIRDVLPTLLGPAYVALFERIAERIRGAADDESSVAEAGL